MASTKSIRKMARPVIAPQRSHGRQRVSSILKAAAAVFAEKGYEDATMAEIAGRAKSPIGSLYRFFPTKELLAGALLEGYVGYIHNALDAIASEADSLSTAALADALIDVLADPARNDLRAGVMLLIETRSEWSGKPQEFRASMIKRIAGLIRQRAPSMPAKEARDVAMVVLHTMKTMKTLTSQKAGSGPLRELRLMNRLYLAKRLA